MEACFVSFAPVGWTAPVRGVTCSRTALSRRVLARKSVCMCAGAKDAEGKVSPPSDGTAPAPTTVSAVGQKPPSVEEEEDLRSEQQKEIDRLRAAEKFVEVDEGKFACPVCDYEYEPSKGEFLRGVKAGTAFVDLPSQFICPVCKTPKDRFVPVRKTIAGFAENQQYGFGGNTLTAGQKNALIFGGLGLMVLFLLSGYALN